MAVTVAPPELSTLDRASSPGMRQSPFRGQCPSMFILLVAGEASAFRLMGDHRSGASAHARPGLSSLDAHCE
jgi:hypothetical protein